MLTGIFIGAVLALAGYALARLARSTGGDDKIDDLILKNRANRITHCVGMDVADPVALDRSGARVWKALSAAQGRLGRVKRKSVPKGARQPSSERPRLTVAK